MRIGGDHVDELRFQHFARPSVAEEPRMRRGEHSAGVHLQDHAVSIRKLLQPSRFSEALEALHMRKDRLIPRDAQRQRSVLQIRPGRRWIKLHQRIPLTVQRRKSPLRQKPRGRRIPEDFAAGIEPQIQPFFFAPALLFLKMAHVRFQRKALFRGHRVTGADHCMHALLRRAPKHLLRLLKGFRSVIHTVDDMMMYICKHIHAH